MLPGEISYIVYVDEFSFEYHPLTALMKFSYKLCKCVFVHYIQFKQQFIEYT